MKSATVHVRGRAVRVRAVDVDGRTVVVRGRWLRIAALHDEEWIENDAPPDPARVAEALRRAGLGVDLLTFAGPLRQGDATLSHFAEADNAAVVRTADFRAWWDGLPQEARKNTRRAAKRGLEVGKVDFDDRLVAGIKSIYDESPVRQGRAFWHYGKDLETVRRENASYLERATFLAAFHESEIVGFIKWVRVGDVARIMQILTLAAHQDKRPMNALISKAVEVCARDGVQLLVYSRFTYGRKVGSSITEFKRRVGFEQLDYPRYWVPLSLRGRLALRAGLQHGLTAILPPWIITRLLKVRGRWLDFRHRSAARGETASAEREAPPVTDAS